MKSLLTVAAIAGTLALAAPASAQLHPPTMSPTGAPPAGTTYLPPTPSWIQDDGSSSDHPTHMPGDFSSDELNQRSSQGIPVNPPHGLPAPYALPER